MSFRQIYRDKAVFLTGHTGFKGSWLAEWLVQLGARVTGYSLSPPTTPSLFNQLGLASRIERHVVADIRDQDRLREVLSSTRPDFVFHLAAQPLVRESYRHPVDTYTTNVLGSVHLLEALRELTCQCAAVLVTTDKCYENREDARAYSEEDSLGGHDPYSSSKAAMEIAVSSWRRAYFGGHPVRLATGRAGNVIGGGDWAVDRIVPDCIRALQRGEPVSVRNPRAVRPWQHVLEPLSGYLWLAARLAAPSPEPGLASAFNFGPAGENSRSVREVVEALLLEWPGTWVDSGKFDVPHEANLLQLSIAKARTVLPWSPVWEFRDTIRETASWYRAVWATPSAAHDFTCAQISAYTACARSLGIPWAVI